MLVNLAFYPSLGYNLLRNYLQPSKWMWYNRIDETIVVGALPFKSMQDELIKKENIGGVVCCVEDYELQYAYNAIQKEDWIAAGVSVHHIPMSDFVGSAGRAQIDSAVQFIEDISSTGKSVYVHCKAGRTRSATVAVCYLVKSRNWLPNVAVEFLKSKRHQTILRNAHWRTANEYRRFLDKQPSRVSTPIVTTSA
ncbi:dual specificity phosphatase, catalytic domain protein [Dictyocaulus viviparus]|uniref:Phosphatidylglycerophosphatase and protein-tyrosine phosphatase 1 n=1 Tax=Dictyocaulus viviparus TaxID=29172 RepID=A0A0D8X7U8_DICVI|nr:dual specificity phosphatase, catalytic domain protein [Dictyocaulus viviparus]